MFTPSSISAAAFVFAVSFFVYYNSLCGGFVFDDHRAILTNDDLDPEKTDLWGVFVNDFWGGHMSRSESHKSYRPLTVLTYRYLNFWFSRLEPFAYHLVNVLLHCAASVLFLLVCLRLLGGRRKKWAAIYAATLFSVHSIHTEAVASVVGRAEVLACIFFLFSLLCYMAAVSNGSGKTLTSTEHTKWSFVLLSMLMSSLSLLSKEQGVTVIGVCAAFDVFLNWDHVWCSLSRKGRDSHDTTTRTTSSSELISQQTNHKLTKASIATNSHVNNGLHVNGISSKPSTSKKSKKLSSVGNPSPAQNMAQRIGLLVVCGLVLVCFRMSMNYGSQPVFKPYEMRAAFHPDIDVRMLSFSNLYAHNAWLLIFPSGLCCDWSLGTVPVVTSLSDTRNLFSLALYASLLILLLHTLCSKRDRMTVGMAMSLLLLPFLPASGILLRVGFVIAERVLYMPSLGFCLLVAIGVRRLVATCPKVLVPLLNAFMACLVIVTAVKTLSRNEDWSSDLALFKSGVKVNPNNVKLRNNLAMELKSAGRLEEAQRQYLTVMEIDPDYEEVYFNYGNLLSDAARYEEAAVYFEKAVQNPGTRVKSLNNLATMYYRLGRWAESETLYKESLEQSGDHETTYNNLASLYGETKRFKESEEMFRKALELNPHYTEAYFNLGTLYIQMQRYPEAEWNLKHALQLNPNHYGAANNLKAVETLEAQRQEWAQLHAH